MLSAAHMTQIRFCLFLLWTLPAWAAETEIGTVTMPLDGNLSAAIYEPGGQIVRTLLSAAPHTKDAVVKLVWDGKDDAGKPVPAGTYRWKSLASRAKGVDDGWVGELANPPYGELSEHGAHVEAVAVDSAGNVYETSGWEEAHQELRAWSPDGKGLRYRGAGGGQGLAVDEQYVYQLAENTVRRYTRDKFLLRNWIGTLRGTIELAGGVVAVGVGKDTLWVCGKDRVELRDKVTGDVTKSIALPAPRAVAVDARGYGWVANSGDRVTEYAPDGTKGREITGLKTPGALAFGGPQQHLYVGEVATGRVLEYDLAKLAQVRALFSAAQPGPVRDTALYWPLTGRASLAVDAQGRITVADIGGHRVLTFTPQGELLRMRYSEMVTAPMVDAQAAPDLVLSHNMEYQVNYRPGPGYGSWTVLNNWWGAYNGVRRKLGDRQYLFSINNGKKITVFDLTDDAMRPCAVIGADAGLYVWTDTNGDGKRQDEETVKTPGDSNYATYAPGVWVDGAGNFWIANWGGATVKLPLDGIDAKGNPRYDWTQKQTVIAKDTTKWGLDPRNLRVDPKNGDIYRVGWSSYYKVPGESFWMGGSVVERYSADGQRISAFPTLGGKDAVVIATDSDGQYFYTGHSGGNASGGLHWIRMYTNDGLLVTICHMGGPSGNNGGWMDHGFALTAFTHPKTGVHYAYAEEVYWGKSIRYRIDNLNTLVRPGQGEFTWELPTR
jgi:hypothetical protein